MTIYCLQIELLKKQPKEYWKWRIQVLKRDNFTCKRCGKHGKGVHLHAHPVKSWMNHPELRFAVDNGQTLCVNCDCLAH